MTLLSPDHLVTDILVNVDQIISTFVKTGYTALVSHHLKEITLLLTLYIIGYGYRAIFHLTSLQFSMIVIHLIRLLIIYMLLVRWDIYDTFFYNIFTHEPDTLIAYFLKASGVAGGSAHTPSETLNQLFSEGMNCANHLFLIFSSSYLKNGMYLLYGGLVFVMTAASCLYALALLIYAKMATALLLFLGPLFLLFLLWPSMQGFFEKWLQGLMNYAFIPLLTSGLLVLMLTITKTTFPDLQAVSEGSLGSTGLLPFLSLTLLTLLLLKQILPLAASLSGGISLEAMHTITPLIKKSLPTQPFTKTYGYLRRKSHLFSKPKKK